MKEIINPSNLKDYTEKTWFLGNNLLSESDLSLMEQGEGTSFVREEGAIYHVPVINDFPDHYKSLGYSKYFQEIIKEANKRKYVWIFFDRDIES
jgi:hypothetical protein